MPAGDSAYMGELSCRICNGEGMFLAENTDRNHLEIQRCDHCKKFISDLDAWKYVKPK